MEEPLVRPVDMLERGNIYFFYQPQQKEEGEEREPAIESQGDIRDFWMILNPVERYRLIRIGPKKLAEVEDRPKRFWGWVDHVSSDPRRITAPLQRKEWTTEGRGRHTLPAARPAGEGVYALFRHADHVHLAYVLEIPEHRGEVQEGLNIEKEADFLLFVRNPGSPINPAEKQGQPGKPHYPGELLRVFRNQELAPCDPPALLDYEHAELLLVGRTTRLPKEIEVQLQPEEEDQRSAEIFNELRLERDRHPVQPLLMGEWR